MAAETYLEGSANSEDAVVGLLRGKTLDSGLDGLVLFGDQVVESIRPVSQSRLSRWGGDQEPLSRMSGITDAESTDNVIQAAWRHAIQLLVSPVRLWLPIDRQQLTSTRVSCSRRRWRTTQRGASSSA